MSNIVLDDRIDLVSTFGNQSVLSSVARGVCLYYWSGSAPCEEWYDCCKCWLLGNSSLRSSGCPVKSVMGMNLVKDKWACETSLG